MMTQFDIMLNCAEKIAYNTRQNKTKQNKVAWRCAHWHNDREHIKYTVLGMMYVYNIVRMYIQEKIIK